MMDTGTTKTYTVAEINQLIKTTIEHQGFDPYKLMSAAGHAVYQSLRRYWPTARKIAIVCGPGDNGANGYVAATAAVQDPKVALDIILYAEKSPEFNDPIAQQVFVEAKAAGVKMQFGMPILKDREVVIDAIFGNSLRQPIAPTDIY